MLLGLRHLFETNDIMLPDEEELATDLTQLQNTVVNTNGSHARVLARVPGWGSIALSSRSQRLRRAISRALVPKPTLRCARRR